MWLEDVVILLSSFQLFKKIIAKFDYMYFYHFPSI